MKQINLTANFGSTTERHTLKVSAGEYGSLSTGDFSISGSDLKIERLKVTAIPNDGYSFDSWSNGSNRNTIEINENIEEDKEYKAKFAPSTYVDPNTFKYYIVYNNDRHRPLPNNIGELMNISQHSGSFTTPTEVSYIPTQPFCNFTVIIQKPAYIDSIRDEASNSNILDQFDMHTDTYEGMEYVIYKLTLENSIQPQLTIKITGI